jgi:hypothetical protein
MGIQRLFRISLRTALVIVTVLCVFLAWKAKQIRDQKKSVDAILAAGGRIHYDDEYDANSGTPLKASWTYCWLCKQFGHDYVAKVSGVALYPTRDFDADEQVRLLAGIPYLRNLAVWPRDNGKSKISSDAPGGLTDDGLEYIADKLPNLRHLSLLGSTATADGLCHLEKLDQLKSLQPGALHGGPIPGVDDFLKRNPLVKCQ